MMKSVVVDERVLTVFAPAGGAADACVYLYAQQAEGEAVFSCLAAQNVPLICVSGFDWNRDLSPWPAPKCFHGGEAFSGGADRELSRLLHRLVPEAEALLPAPPRRRLIAGYSLAGLFSLYALYKTEAFTLAVSASGSLWYDGWISFIRANAPRAQQPKVYLSLGDREAKTRNPRLRAVEENTLLTRELLLARGAQVVLEMNPGGHFERAAERTARGVSRLLTAEAPPR